MGTDAERNEACRCPYCDAELDETSPICQACSIVFVACINCGAQMREGLEVCPSCGKSRDGEA